MTSLYIFHLWRLIASWLQVKLNGSVPMLHVLHISFFFFFAMWTSPLAAIEPACEIISYASRQQGFAIELWPWASVMCCSDPWLQHKDGCDLVFDEVSIVFHEWKKKSPHWKITDFIYIEENMVYFVIDGQDQAFSSQIATSAGRSINHVSLYPPEHKEPFLFTFSQRYMASVCHRGLITL